MECATSVAQSSVVPLHSITKQRRAAALHNKAVSRGTATSLVAKKQQYEFLFLTGSGALV